jgi:hypothetical protein
MPRADKMLKMYAHAVNCELFEVKTYFFIFEKLVHASHSQFGCLETKVSQCVCVMGTFSLLFLRVN